MKDFVKIGDKEFPTELAVSLEEQEKGLMYRKDPATMSFIYSSPRYNAFWMHKTPMPLDIVFCCNNEIVSICTGTPYSTSVVGGDRLSDLVIELPAGTCSTNNLKVGDRVELKMHSDSRKRILGLKKGFAL